jgi:acetyltransferase-like isoleucine patch superfamily enzyme
MLKGLLNPRPPRIPSFLKPPLRAYYEARTGVIIVWRWLATVFYRHPLFQARCASFGKNVSIARLPYVSGHVEIHIGDDVSIGSMSVTSGRFIDHPKLIIKDRAQIGWGVDFAVNREIVIEEDARVSFNCRISDNDGHRREADLRAQTAPLDPQDIRSVRICRRAWIGNGAQIMKGVTVGEGAVIGANSVVISDIPPYCLAMGNPAEVYFRDYGRPAVDKAAGTPNR